jgi:TolB-like protein
MKKALIAFLAVLTVAAFSTAALAADSDPRYKNLPEPADSASVQKKEPAKAPPPPAKKEEKPAAKPEKASKEQMRLVQVQIRKLADKMAEAIKGLPDGKYGLVAVTTFSESGKLARDKELGKLVSVELMTYFKKEHGLDLVERDKLDKVLKELEVQQSGLIDDATAVKIGKMVAAEALVVGTVSEAGADFIVNARVVAVDTARVLVADNIPIPVSGLVALSATAVELHTKWGAVFRSVIPGWGQFYNGQPIKGGIYAGLTVGFFTTGIAFHIVGDQTVEQYKKATDPQAAKNLKKNAEDKYLIRNIALYCGLGMWVVNLVDAYIFGYDAASALAEIPVLKDTTLTFGPDGAFVGWGTQF